VLLRQLFRGRILQKSSCLLRNIDASTTLPATTFTDGSIWTEQCPLLIKNPKTYVENRCANDFLVMTSSVHPVQTQ
jgi:hypothetical protein